MDEKNIKRKYKEIVPADIIRIGNEFVKEFFFDKGALKLKINSVRIIFNIISNLRNEQFQEKNQPKQLKLFEEDFTSDFNTYAKMKIKNSLITTNSEDLKKAYVHLVDFKKGWYEFQTSDNRKIKAYGGLISNVFHEEKGYTSFLINSYWIKQLLLIPEYNSTLYNLAYKLRDTKHILFWFWLSRIPKEGTQINKQTLNEMFDINYITAKSLCKDFLKPIREKLNRYNYISFNYKIKGDLVMIIPYATASIEQKEENPILEDKIKSNYQIRYFQKRHNLTEKQIEGISYFWKDKTYTKEKIIITQAYKVFIKECRENKIKASDFQGIDFINKLQHYIEQEYLQTNTGKRYPKAFPKI